MKKIPLEILGLSYSQSQSGAYALIIQEKNGLRRIPIIIGNAEAQAIALELENFKTERPFTHDLFYSFAVKFEIELIEIIIYKFSKGIFYSLLVCKQGSVIHEIDSRTSDAIALALRFKCPMYTFEEILKETGIVFEESSEKSETDKSDENEPDTETGDENEEMKRDIFTERSLRKYSVKELNEILQNAIQNEDYELASQIRDELKLRKK